MNKIVQFYVDLHNTFSNFYAPWLVVKVAPSSLPGKTVIVRVYPKVPSLR